MRHVTLALLLAACGSKQGDSPTKACADAAEHAVNALLEQARDRVASVHLSDDARARVEERTQAFEQLAPRQKAVMTNRCVDDKWSADVVRCHATATSLDDVRACKQRLTAEQAAKLQKDELDLMAGPTGLPGLAPPDPGGPIRIHDDLRITKLRHDINEAMKLVATAHNDADRAAAKQKLDVLLAEKAALEGGGSGSGAAPSP